MYWDTVKLFFLVLYEQNIPFIEYIGRRKGESAERSVTVVATVQRKINLISHSKSDGSREKAVLESVGT